MMNSTERWKPVVGYEGFYEISNLGRVKSLDRKIWNGKAFYNKKGRILKQSLTTTGYFKVELTVNKKRKSKKIHRLIAKSFIPMVKGKNIINHKDGNPLNNAIENLEWCTQKENVRHAIETGLTPPPLLEAETDEIVRVYKNNEDETMTNLANKFNVALNVIERILKENEVKIRGNSHYRNKYQIDRVRLIQMLNKECNNKEIVKALGGNGKLISVYRYKHKKGELVI